MSAARYRQAGRPHRPPLLVPLDHTAPDGEADRGVRARGRRRGREDENCPGWSTSRAVPARRQPVLRQAGLARRALQDHRVLLLDQRGTAPPRPSTARRSRCAATPTRRPSTSRTSAPTRSSATANSSATRSPAARPGPCSARASAASAPSATVGRPEGASPRPSSPAACHTWTATRDDVYRAAYPRIERKVAPTTRYPMDVERVRRSPQYVLEHEPVLPSGYRLTLEAFQSLGIWLGGSDGSDRLHHLLEDAFVRTPAGVNCPTRSWSRRRPHSRTRPTRWPRRGARGHLRPGRAGHGLVGGAECAASSRSSTARRRSRPAARCSSRASPSTRGSSTSTRHCGHCARPPTSWRPAR